MTISDPTWAFVGNLQQKTRHMPLRFRTIAYAQRWSQPVYTNLRWYRKEISEIKNKTNSNPISKSIFNICIDTLTDMNFLFQDRPSVKWLITQTS